MAASLSGCAGVAVGSLPSNNPLPPAVTTHGERTLPTYGLPIAYFELTLSRTSEAIKDTTDVKCTFSATLSDKPVYVRDNRISFDLIYHHHEYTADHIKVTTDGQGLLTSINGQSEDKTLAMVEQAFAIAGDIAKLAAGAPLKAENIAPRKCDPISAKFLLDPQNPDDLKRVNDFLMPVGIHIDRLADVGKPTSSDMPDIEVIGGTGRNDFKMLETDATKSCDEATPHLFADDSSREASEAPCIYFRIARTYRLTIWDTEDANLAQYPHGRRYEFLLTAPDTNSIYAIAMNRRPLVKFATTLTFEHGVLTGVETDDPSEGLAILQIPSDIVKGLLGLKPSGK